MPRNALEWTIDGEPVADLELLERTAAYLRDPGCDPVNGLEGEHADALEQLRDQLRRDGVGPGPRPGFQFSAAEYARQAERLLDDAQRRIADLPEQVPGIVARAQVLATLSQAAALDRISRHRITVDVAR